MPDQLIGSLEDNVLTMLVWDEHNAPNVALKVLPDLFGTRAYQKIAQSAINYMSTYGSPPRGHIRDLLETDLSRGEEGRFLSQIIDAMERLASDLQAPYVLSQLDRFVEVRKLTRSVEQAADSLHTGDLESAREALATAGLTQQTPKPGVWLHDTSNWLRFLDKDEDEDLFSSGIDILDERGVRPVRGGLFLIMASSGTGKSWWLIEIAKRSIIENRQKVLHISLENDLEETQQRYTQALLSMTSSEVTSLRVPVFRRDGMGRFSSIDFSQVMPDQISSAKRNEIEVALQKYKNKCKLLVHWFPTGMLTVGQLASLLDTLDHTEGFKPDLVVLDYADLMHTDSRDLRISLGQLFRDLRGLAGSRNFAMVTATQGNRISSTARIVGANMVSEDWSKIGTADTVCTYSQTLDERDIGIARVLVAKARRSRDKWIALLTQSYATGQFCLDSCFFNKLAESEVLRHTGGEEDRE